MRNCYKGDVASQWEIAIFGHLGPKTPEPIELKFGTIDYVRDGTTHANFDKNWLGGGDWANTPLVPLYFVFFY